MNASKLVLGTVQFGLNYGINNSAGQPPLEKCFDILNFANQSGILELDTADAYGNAQEVLRSYFTNKKSPSFKVMGKFSVEASKSFTQSFNESLARLGIAEMEGYYFHRFNDFLNFKNFDEVGDLKKKGVLKKLAVSLYTDEELAEVVSHKEVDVIQLPFNLLDRSENKKRLLKEARENKKEIYIRSTFLQGLFFKNPENLPASLRPLKEALSEINRLAAEYKMTMEELCLNYVLHRTYIDKVIIGVDSPEQLESNLHSLKVEFPEELVKKIESIEVADTRLLNPATWGAK